LARQVDARAADLRESNERLRSIIDSAVDGIIVIDGKGTIEAFNRGAERLFGYPQSEVMGRNVSVLMPSPITRSTTRIWRGISRLDQPRSSELVAR
jgi:PAS domain S-box-containing protein